MFSSIHNRFSIATETKYGAIPPTFLSIAENKEPEPDLSITKENKTEMEETVENVTEEIPDMVVENIIMSLCEAPEPIESKEIEDEVVEKHPPVSNKSFVCRTCRFCFRRCLH